MINKYASLVDKVKVLINPSLAGKEAPILRSALISGGLGAALGGGAGAKILADIIRNREARLGYDQLVGFIPVPALSGKGAVIGGTAGFAGGAAAGTALGFAAKKALIANAKANQKKALKKALTAGAVGTGAAGIGSYLGSR